MLHRELDLRPLIARKSLFLFGPRATGKSSLIEQTLSDDALVLSLLDTRLALELLAEPYRLESIVLGAGRSNSPIVVIDEIQKVPALLDEVHRLIESRKWRFLLTGSSARKLKRGAANLLAGRAPQANLYPLVRHEIPDFDLGRYLLFGGLPAVYLSPEPADDLDAYVNTYLREEIQAEGFVRKLPPFARFLKTLAISHGQVINFAKMASDTAVPASTLREYLSILHDTLVGFNLEAWADSKKRKAITTAKFYFFDTGVRNSLAGTHVLDRTSNTFGNLFETFIGMELRAFLGYSRSREPLRYWRSTSHFEVDFLVGTSVAIEVKATERVNEQDLKGLRALAEEGVFSRFVLVSQDPSPRVVELGGGATASLLPWTDFLDRLWNNEFSPRA